MNLARHHLFALTAALGLSAIAIFDAITHGLTGHWSMFADDGDHPWVIAVGGFVHGLAYLGCLWVLHKERNRIRANRAARVSGWLLFAAFVPLAVGFLLLAPLQPYGLVNGVYAVAGPVIGIAFVLQFLAATVLGLSLLRHPETGVGSRILAAMPAVIALTILLALVAGDWAHPAYLEATVIVGTALLGTATPRRQDLPALADLEQRSGSIGAARGIDRTGAGSA